MQVLIFIAVVGLIWIAVAWLIRRGRSEYRVEAAILAEINAIPIDEAERQAHVLLTEGRRFRCVEAPILRAEELTPLAHSVRKIFQHYETVESLDGSLVLDRKVIGPSSISPGFITIGPGMTGTDSEFELVVRESADPVLELYPRESIDSVFGTYSSVYHWVLAAARELDESGAGGQK